MGLGLGRSARRDWRSLGAQTHAVSLAACRMIRAVPVVAPRAGGLRGGLLRRAAWKSAPFGAQGEARTGGSARRGDAETTAAAAPRAWSSCQQESADRASIRSSRIRLRAHLSLPKKRCLRRHARPLSFSSIRLHLLFRTVRLAPDGKTQRAAPQGGPLSKCEPRKAQAEVCGSRRTETPNAR